MQINFIEANPATHFGIDAEDIQEIVEFDSMCDQLWPIWVMKKCGHPVAWYCEAQEVACVIR